MTTAALASPVADEVDRFRRAGAYADGLALARAVGREVLRHGRHHLGPGLLTALDAIRRGHGGRDPFLDAYLDAVLARRRDRFRTQSYLALPLLELVRADLGVDHERLSALLIADVIRHELRPDHAGRVDHRTRDARVRLAARFVADVDPALDARWLPGPWFALTVLPVSAGHDEYFFVRSLQAHEAVFMTLAELLREATEALRAGEVVAATACLTRATAVLGRTALLFPLVATLRRSAFRSFRRHIEGTSGMRSEAYERFALACGGPVADAYGAGSADVDTFTRAWNDVGDPEALGLLHAVGRLEVAHQRWRTTRDALTTAMLGDGPGLPATVRYRRDGDRLFDLGARSARPMAA